MQYFVRSVQSLFETYVQSGASVAPDVGQAIAQAEDSSYLADLAASAPDLTREQRQQLLEMTNVADRLHAYFE